MQSIARLAFLLTVLLAGCSTVPPTLPTDPLPQPPASTLTEFSWTGVGDLGDHYMHLRVEVTEPSTCSLFLHAEGLEPADQLPATVGIVSPDQAQVLWGSRGLAPSAKAAGSYYAPVHDALNATWYIQDIRLDASLARGEHVFFWAASDVQPYDGSATSFDASLTCDFALTVLERAIGDAPLLFRETGPDGLMVTDGASTLTMGTLAYDQPGPVLFAFEDRGAVAGSLDLQHAAGVEHWDLQGAGDIAGARDGLEGPFALALTRLGGPLELADPAALRWGSVTGLLSAYQVVADFPPGIPTAPAGQTYHWNAAFNASGDELTNLLWDVEVDLATDASCTIGIGALGTRLDYDMSIVFGRYADGQAELHWSGEPLIFPETRLPADEQPRPVGEYPQKSEDWGVQTPAGRNHFYWGASGAESLQASLLCDVPFTVAGRSQSVIAAFPRNLAFHGAWANAGFVSAQAETTYEFGSDGPTLFLWDDNSIGAGSLRMDHGGPEQAWTLGPTGVPQAVVADAVGPIRLTMTSAGALSIWYGVLAQMESVEALPGEALA